jgi:peptidoglycan/xylan/chitin deacetylase (PgdA/CDA1 family)
LKTKPHKPAILLTFDVEEFDAALEFGNNIPLSEQLEVSTRGMKLVQEVLDRQGVVATIFTTGTYAIHNKSFMQELAQRHEIASHGMYHGSFDAKKDLPDSKLVLEEITGQEVVGFRMARMMPVEESDIVAAGYSYNSSLTPTLRFPMFWLSFKNLPFSIYKYLSMNTLRENGFLNVYFHPWEFTDLAAYNMPTYVKRHSKDVLIQRLEEYIIWLKDKGEFMTMKEYAANFEL